MNERYSCVFENPLLETNQNLRGTLAMLASIGYSARDFGRTNLGPNTDRGSITHRDIYMILLENPTGKDSVGLVKKVEVSSKEEGYIAYYLRF